MANPVISNLAGDIVLFVEDGTALLLDAFAQVGVSDPDSPDFNGATLTISIAGALPEDLLSILAIGDITARPVGFPDTRFLVYHGNPTSADDVIGEVVSDGTNGSNLVIELGPDPGASSPSPITADKIAALIHAIAYRNSNTADPAAHDRTVTYTLTDGDDGSTTATVTIQVQPVNDAPTIEGPLAAALIVDESGIGGAFSGEEFNPVLSADGKFMIFQSDTATLVPGITPGREHIFLKDLTTGAVTLVTTGIAGTEANADSRAGSISADGRYVAFGSAASNLVTGDLNGFQDVFLWDRLTGETRLVTTSAGGAQANASTFVSEDDIKVTADGQFVVFITRASNLVTGDVANTDDVLVKNMVTGEVIRASLNANGEVGVDTDSDGNPTAPFYLTTDISDDGRWVAFDTDADNMVPGYDQGPRNSVSMDVYLKDLQTGTVYFVSESNIHPGAAQEGLDGSRFPHISADGRYVLFDAGLDVQPEPTAGAVVWDRVTGAVREVGTTATGVVANLSVGTATISRSGNFVAFTSRATNLTSDSGQEGVDKVFIKNLVTGEIAYIGPGLHGEYYPWVSDDGRVVLYVAGEDYAPGDSDGEDDVYAAFGTDGGGIPVIENTPSPVKGITFDDIDAGSNPVTVTFTVERGTLSALPFGNVTVSDATGLSITLEGPFADINAFLEQDRLLYTTALDDEVDVPILVRIDDNGHSGSPGGGGGGGGFRAEGREGSPGLFVEAMFVLAVTPLVDPGPGQNDAPVNTVPATREFEANVPAAITGLSVADLDSGAGVITTTLSLQFGILTLAATGGAAIDHNGTDAVTLTGTLAQINAALAGNNVVYSAPTDFFGSDTLTMFTNDNGNSGQGGPLTDTDHVTIHLNTYLEGSDGDDTFHALPGNEFIVARLGHDTVAFDFALTDATVTWRNNLVIIDGPSSHTVLSGFETYVFTDGTVQNADDDRLVDDLFYYSRNHELWNAQTDADAHYHATGWREGRDPNAFFDTDLYLAVNPDIRNAGIDPLVHFDQSGWREGRVASPNFDPAKYLAFYGDVAAANRDPLEHFLRHGAEENRLPFAASVPLAANGFDFAYYLLHNPDVAAAGIDPRVHFETIGWREGRNPNALFDVNGYLAHYSDVANAGLNPLEHYHQSGWREGRDPSVDFDSSAYLAAYPDVAAANRDPLAHYLQFGIHEGRATFADGVWG